ncbi:ABC transporter [Brachyspira hampsonii]|uniref:ABC transporter n=1 Tax=Brachyspira hampsonii TaxID=1287055 RepID=A0A1E5NHY7_9SPIR|nr:sugar ABC transporter ATP-binding protein [Brachyspira hampsonii]OEJ15770.1 ABC transporter [Brachyspira hampsonii]
MENFIKVKNISKSFNALKALDDVSFELAKGEALALCGANGSGKSTLIKILAGVLEADSGVIEIDGKEMYSYGPLSGIKHGISVIYQDISLFPTLSVLENICLPRMIGDSCKFAFFKNKAKSAKAILADLEVDIDINSIVEELPLASQQLIAIARALNNNSKLIILDEPTTALTRVEVNQLFKIVNKLKKNGISVIFISHKLDEVIELCDTLVCLRDGKLVASKPMSETSVEEIEKFMVGQSSVYTGVDDIDKDAPIVLEVDSLTKKNNYKDISFNLRRGEILGIIGLLGSGRTELALSLFGVSKSDSGKIYIDGKECRINSIQDAVEAKIAYVPEDRLTEGLIMNYPINDNMVIVNLNKVKNKFGFLDNSIIKKITNFWIKELSIKAESGDNKVSTLSGGNQQKIVIGKWLDENPKILILDGPTVGIDIGAKAGIFETIKEFSKDNGMSVILISDEIKEIVSYSNRIMIMRNGKIYKIFDRGSVDENDIQTMLDEQKRSL